MPRPREHVLEQFDRDTRIGTCRKCGPVGLVSNGRGKMRCIKAHREGTPNTKVRVRRSGMDYSVFKKDHCERCGFIPEDMCQLDVHHLDGNHKNNSEGNHQTLCANCHRLTRLAFKSFIGPVARLAVSRRHPDSVATQPT